MKKRFFYSIIVLFFSMILYLIINENQYYKCKEISLYKNYSEMNIHHHNNYHTQNYDIKIIIYPYKDNDGIQLKICKKCNYKKYIKYECPHLNIDEYISKEATCSEDGIKEIKCIDCEKILESKTIEKKAHIFSDWENDSTEKIVRTCKNCGIKEYKKSEKYYNTKSVESKDIISNMKDNYIYIPNTGINNNFKVSSLTQSAVNHNDLIYAYAYDFGLGENDPFILGHNYGTMSNLKKICIGQYIYISVNGQIETYTVSISELAKTTDDETDIIGLTSGYSIFQNLGTKTLHLYTCDNRIVNGRWIVLAKKI